MQYNINIFLILIVLTVCSTQDNNSNQNSMNIISQFQHKYTVDILSSFNIKSDVSVVVTSCNQIDMLSISINSFFHFNTYVLRQIIIIDYCGANQKDIWKLLPKQAQQYINIYFTVLTVPVNQGKFSAINLAYSYIQTKYVYHFNHEWVHIGTYGFIQRFKDALQHIQIQNKQIKISQISQTYPNINISLIPSILYRTNKNTKYYILSSFTRQYTNVFNFNPHFINFNTIYQQLMNNSYKDTIMRLYKCNQFKITEISSYIDNVDKCIEFYLSQFMEMNGYKQLYVDLGKSSIYININKLIIKKWKSLNFEIPLKTNYTEKQRVIKQYKSKPRTKKNEINNNNQYNKFGNQQISKQAHNFITQLLQIMIISVCLFILYKIIQTVILCCRKSGPQVSMPKTIHSSQLVRNDQQ